MELQILNLLDLFSVPVQKVVLSLIRMEESSKPVRLLLSPPPLRVNYDQLPVNARTRASWSGKDR